MSFTTVCQATGIVWWRQFLLVKPYNDIFSPNRTERVRTFEEDINELDLIWHRDTVDRKVMVMEGKRWKLQMDNQLPFVMEKGVLYDIPKMVYHRVIKGNGQLRLKIWDL